MSFFNVTIYVTCLQETDGLRLCRASDEHSGVFWTKICKLYHSLLPPKPLRPCYIPLTASEHPPYFCKTQAQTSSSPLLHLPSFKSRMLMTVPTHFVLRGPIHLLCSQFLLEKGKLNSHMEIFAEIQPRGLSESITSSLPTTQGSCFLFLI